MNKRVLMAGVLGAVAMFLWSFIAHMALPLGEAGVRQIDNEQPLLDQMKSTLSAPGLYLFPGMVPNGSQAEYQRKIANGASGLLIYMPSRNFSFGSALGFEFMTEFVQALVAAYLLSLTRIANLSGRLRFYALVGLIAAVATNIPYWNWYAFPLLYTSAYMFTQWVGYLCAGLVATVVALPRTAVAAA